MDKNIVVSGLQRVSGNPKIKLLGFEKFAPCSNNHAVMTTLVELDGYHFRTKVLLLMNQVPSFINAKFEPANSGRKFRPFLFPDERGVYLEEGLNGFLNCG